MSRKDLINHPHYHSPRRPYMSRNERAAQFAPFKALDGFESQISDQTEDIMGQIWEEIDYSDSQPERPVDF